MTIESNPCTRREADALLAFHTQFDFIVHVMEAHRRRFLSIFVRFKKSPKCPLKENQFRGPFNLILLRVKIAERSPILKSAASQPVSTTTTLPLMNK